MSRPLAVVILAAGKGTRMKSETPKVMHKIIGKPMIKWVIEAAQELKPEKIITVIGPDMSDVKDIVSSHDTVIQKERNGTGGALKCALPKLKGFNGDVLVLLGDVPLISKKTLKNLVKARNKDMLTRLSVLTLELDNPTGYGRIITGQDGTAYEIIEEKDASTAQKKIKLVNAGAFCFEGPKLKSWTSKLDDNNSQKEYYLTDLVKIAAKDGALCAISKTENTDELRNCNSRTDLAALEKTAQNQLRKEHMASGVTLIDPSSVYFYHDTAIAHDTVIEPNVHFGPGVIIEKNVTIKAFTHIEGAHIKSGVSIGPFARVRPDSEIGENARIGNFVEIKKSKIGAGSKIGHLAYVGDTLMGEEVNFSCGAITVNYDGFQKHQTVIGKNVMVGSNVNLVAPVSIDDGAFIAAGSTITEDVPADALSIARDVAEIRQGWAAKYRKLKAAAAKKRKKSASPTKTKKK
jgi:bifunctional UDP-N-acetylglucosamine pyrophosphorylase/glucosamine-1-phosphate N-acetyltransferase